MAKIRRLMVGLDFTMMDANLIRYAGFISYYYQPEKIYFIHIQASMDISSEIQELFPEVYMPVDEQMRDKMKSSVEEYFPDHKTYDIEYKVVEGSPRKEILRWVNIKMVDLMIVGRKSEMNGSGVVPKQLARKLDCSVLFVPENPVFELRSVLVACDYSEFSKSALQSALALGKVDDEIEFWVESIYSVPLGYYKTGKTEEEFAAIVEGHLRNKHLAFLKELKMGEELDIKSRFVYDHKRKSPAIKLYESSKEINPDLIVMGARGRNMATQLFLGSVAEKMIQLNQDKALLIVKERDQSFSFIDMIELI